MAVLDRAKRKEVEQKAKATEQNVGSENRIVRRMVARLESIKGVLNLKDGEATGTLIENFYAAAKYQPTWTPELTKLQMTDLDTALKGKLVVGAKRGRAAKATASAKP